MKKSEIYVLAQKAVADNLCMLTADQKLEILRTLMQQEDLEKYREGRDENEAVH